MKKCINCGRILNDEHAFCGSCGGSEFIPVIEQNIPVNTTAHPKKEFTRFDLFTVLGFVSSIIGFFQIALILEPIALVSSLIGFLKGNRSKGLAVAGFVISVIALLIKLFDTLNSNGLIPKWLFAGTFG